MPDFRFIYPIEVRYGDLDPQGHVNNANFLTYFEQARVKYLIALGLFTKNQSFLDVGIILADAHVTFLSPVLYGMDVRVGVRVTRLGGKSIRMSYRMFDAASGTELATGTTIQVTYDYRRHTTIPVPYEWRQKISSVEGIPPQDTSDPHPSQPQQTNPENS